MDLTSLRDAILSCYFPSDNDTILEILNKDVILNEAEQNHANQSLFMALKNTNVFPSVLIKMIDCGADINLTDSEGNTALMIAIKQGIIDLSLIEYMVKSGADLSKINADGRTALMLALDFDDKDVPTVMCLINNGSDLDVRDNNRKSTLMMALLPLHLHRHPPDQPVCPIIVAMLDKGVKIPYELHDVIIYRHPSIVRLMLDTGRVDIRILKHGQPSTGIMTILMHAIENHMSLDIIKTIVELGDDVNSISGMGDSSVLCAVDEAAKYNANDSSILLYLLDNGVTAETINTRNDAGNCPLGMAIATSSQLPEKGRPIFKALLEKGAEIDHRLFEWAIEKDAVCLIEVALESKLIFPWLVRPSKSRNAPGRLVSPLYKAIHDGSLSLVKPFLKYNFFRQFDVSHFPEYHSKISGLIEKFGSHPESSFLVKNMSPQPQSLWMLSFLQISESMGFKTDRGEKVAKSGLPPSLQRKLMFELHLKG